MSRVSPTSKFVARSAIIAASLLFVAVVVYRTLAIPGHECEVCIEFRGRTVCRTVQAANTAEARSGAITNACALLSSGVTDTLACERTPPKSMACRATD